MKKSTRIALAAAAIVTAGGMIAAVAQADSRGHGERGYHDEGGKRGGHHRGAKGGHGGKGGMLRIFETFDTNGDGVLTQIEIDAVRAGRLAEFDANGDTVLALDEYQALWLDAMHERMVDRFQHLDADGDGQVTVVEFNRPFAHMVARGDRNEDGKLDSDDRRHRAPHHGDDGDDNDDDDNDDDDDDDTRRGPGDGPMMRRGAQ